MTHYELSGRIALVTGASRGIGFATAKALATSGAHVIALARTVGGLEELDDAIKAAGGQASLIPVDITDQEAMNQLQPVLFERFGKIDIFVANAGILGELAPITDLDRKTWNELLDVNLTANWHLTAILDPLLRQSDAGRAVYVTSSVARSVKPFWGGYAISKAALEMLALTYAEEVKASPIKVNLLNPGGTRTDMRAKAMPGEDPETLPHPDEVAKCILEMSAPSFDQHGSLVTFRDWRS